MAMGVLLVILTVISPAGEANQAMKHQQSSSSAPEAPAKKTWKRYLAFLSKFQRKMKHKKAPNGFKQRNPKRSSRPMLEECSNLVRVVRRTAAGCFAAATAAGGGGLEEELPSYMQLDQVTYEVKREAFGPIYLVT
ncbi:uncharacterized protein LOC133903783 isoform X2 [Phragmites australis]|uniref:uncharacterized protein LOC133903783 isoform X2 n=1 Tax=Phragmites australis TaxID=29695 RepID=UPI002D787C23|nr:uncharacterized protein LOC133903783 isoform X2 [Phragmites australis]